MGQKVRDVRVFFVAADLNGSALILYISALDRVSEVKLSHYNATQKYGAVET
jgi:hypothetical protein